MQKPRFPIGGDVSLPVGGKAVIVDIEDLTLKLTPYEMREIGF